MRTYDFSALSVLVVDDNRHFISILRTCLRDFGVRQVIEAVDEPGALQILEKNDVDLALIDLRLERTNGLDLVRRIRTGPNMRNTLMPIIIVTAHSEQSWVLEAISIGVNEFLCKPISPKILYERLVHLVEQPRPFLRAADYFGPDRRRTVAVDYFGHERRRPARTFPLTRRGTAV